MIYKDEYPDKYPACMIKYMLLHMNITSVQALNMRVIDGMNDQEIAKMFGMSRSSITLARNRLSQDTRLKKMLIGGLAT